MANSGKVTKRALLASVLALSVSVSMLIGTSYAWFTDSVASTGNIIKSGTLSIDLGIKTKNDTDYVSVKEHPDKKAFDYVLWEPGYTEWVNAKVTTDGDLALKYTMKIAANGEVTALADVIDVYYKDSEVQKPANRDLSGLRKLGTLRQAINGTIVINDYLIPKEGNTEDCATIALHMQETAGNEYQNMSIGSDFSIQILAAQYTYETDSFNDQYDKDALFPGEYKGVGTVPELVDAVTAGESVKLKDNLVVSNGTNLTYTKDATIDLAGKSLVISGGASLKTTSGVLNIVNNSESSASIELNGSTIMADGVSAVINIENVEITMYRRTSDKIQVINGATVNMKNGKLISKGEPCVYIANGTFNMYGGEIVVPAKSNGITCGTGTNVINLHGGKIDVANNAIGINTMVLNSMGLNSIYISGNFVFELASDTAASLFILSSQEPTITGTEPDGIIRYP